MQYTTTHYTADAALRRAGRSRSVGVTGTPANTTRVVHKARLSAFTRQTVKPIVGA